MSSSSSSSSRTCQSAPYYARFCLLQGHRAFLLQWMVSKFKTSKAGGWEGLCWLKQPSTKSAAFPLRDIPLSSSRVRTCLDCVAEVLRFGSRLIAPTRWRTHAPEKDYPRRRCGTSIRALLQPAYEGHRWRMTIGGRDPREKTSTRKSATCVAKNRWLCPCATGLEKIDDSWCSTPSWRTSFADHSKALSGLDVPVSSA